MYSIEEKRVKENAQRSYISVKCPEPNGYWGSRCRPIASPTCPGGCGLAGLRDRGSPQAKGLAAEGTGEAASTAMRALLLSVLIPMLAAGCGGRGERRFGERCASD